MFQRYALNAVRNSDGVDVFSFDRHHLCVRIEGIEYLVECERGPDYLDIWEPVTNEHYNPADRALRDRLRHLAAEGMKTLGEYKTIHVD